MVQGIKSLRSGSESAEIPRRLEKKSPFALWRHADNNPASNLSILFLSIFYFTLSFICSFHICRNACRIPFKGTLLPHQQVLSNILNPITFQDVRGQDISLPPRPPQIPSKMRAPHARRRVALSKPPLHPRRQKQHHTSRQRPRLHFSFHSQHSLRAFHWSE